MSTRGGCTTISSAFSSAAESPSIGRSTAPRGRSRRSAPERASGVVRVVGRAQVVVKALGWILREDVHAQDAMRRLSLAFEDEAHVHFGGAFRQEEIAPALAGLPVARLRIDSFDIVHERDAIRTREAIPLPRKGFDTCRLMRLHHLP